MKGRSVAHTTIRLRREIWFVENVARLLGKYFLPFRRVLSSSRFTASTNALSVTVSFSIIIGFVAGTLAGTCEVNGQNKIKEVAQAYRFATLFWFFIRLVVLIYLLLRNFSNALKLSRTNNNASNALTPKSLHLLQFRFTQFRFTQLICGPSQCISISCSHAVS